MHERVELSARREGGRVRLLSPDVGILTRALGRGAALAPGQVAGTLLRLGRAVELVVPEGVRGVVVSERPERVHAPVGHGDTLYELEPLDGAGAEVASDPGEAGAEADRALLLPSPQSGRFYHRPAPRDDAFVEVGDVVEAGAPVGLIEVMKTFTHVVYRASAGLPRRARVLRLVAADGADVQAGEPLLEVEEA